MENSETFLWPVSISAELPWYIVSRVLLARLYCLFLVGLQSNSDFLIGAAVV